MTNFQQYILNHGPAWPGLPQVCTFHPVQSRPCPSPSPNSIQSSRVTRPSMLSQPCNMQTSAIRVRVSAAPLSAQVHSSWSTAGTLNVHCMYPDRPKSPSWMPPRRRDDETVVHLRWIRQIRVQQSSCQLLALPLQARRGDDLHNVSHVSVVGTLAVGPAR